MSQKNWSEIQEAADSILGACLNDGAPLTTLNSRLALLATSGWDGESIMEVESAVLDALDLMKHTELVAVP